MDKRLELSLLLNANQEIISDMLWNKIYDTFRYFDDIARMTTDSNVLEYIRNIKKEESDFRKDISVNNDYIDIMLKRYKLEGAMINITVVFHSDSLEGLSVESTIAVIKILDKCFDKIFDCRGKSQSFLQIKAQKESIRIYAEKAEALVLDEEFPVTWLD